MSYLFTTTFQIASFALLHFGMEFPYKNWTFLNGYVIIYYVKTPTQRMNIVAFTKDDTFSALGDKSKNFPYKKVVALWHNDGSFGRHVGEKNTSGRDEKVLSLSPIVGKRLMSSFDAIVEGQVVNCHRFAREISGMPFSTTEPIHLFGDLPIAGELPEGSMGIIGVEGFGVPHSIGYGLGDTGLQVMSAGGELGFADNKTVVDFYRQLYPSRVVTLRQFQQPI